LAELSENELTLRAAVGARGGQTPVVTAIGTGPAGDPISVARQVFDTLQEEHVMHLLHGHD